MSNYNIHIKTDDPRVFDGLPTEGVGAWEAVMHHRHGEQWEKAHQPRRTALTDQDNEGGHVLPGQPPADSERCGNVIGDEDLLRECPGIIRAGQCTRQEDHYQRPAGDPWGEELDRRHEDDKRNSSPRVEPF